MCRPLVHTCLFAALCVWNGGGELIACSPSSSGKSLAPSASELAQSQDPLDDLVRRLAELIALRVSDVREVGFLPLAFYDAGAVEPAVTRLGLYIPDQAAEERIEVPTGKVSGKPMHGQSSLAGGHSLGRKGKNGIPRRNGDRF